MSILKSVKTQMHKPVLYQQALNELNIKSDGIYFDGTFGRGGHAMAILKHLSDQGQLLACDRDQAAIEFAQTQACFKTAKFKLYHHSFAQMVAKLKAEGLAGKIDGIFLDLGVSSPQLDDAHRGFSFQMDGPLDMRMDKQQKVDAASWLAQATEQEIAEVLWQYGEERFSKRIARAIVTSRVQAPLTTTSQLVKLIENVCPKYDKHKHPATRSFQAIRIKVNDELGQLTDFLDQALDLLAPGGRLVIISFHSLEDRIVKQWMRTQVNPNPTPGKLPVRASENQARINIITRKPIVADAAEICHNPRSRSAKMRVAEKCHDQRSSDRGAGGVYPA